MKTNRKNPGAGLFLVLTLIFLGISIWQTALGYELMFGKHLAWIFSFAIGIMMLFLAFEMRKRIISDEGAIGPLIGYIACGIFCFFGNFNAIYSRYNRDELFKKELMAHKNELVSVVTASTAALDNFDPGFIDLKTKTMEHKGQLIAQLTNQGQEGRGVKADEEIRIIGELLGQNLTELNGSPAQLAEGYSRNIDNILETRYTSGRLGEANKLSNEIKSRQKELTPLIMNALKPQNIANRGQEAIFSTVDAINEIGTRTKNFLGEKSKFRFKEAEFKNQEIGKISHTFASAFNGENWATAIISLLVAFAIDALVPFVIFVGTKREEQEDHDADYYVGHGRIQIIR